jgi:hypothetical protein
VASRKTFCASEPFGISARTRACRSKSVRTAPM